MKKNVLKKRFHHPKLANRIDGAVEFDQMLEIFKLLLIKNGSCGMIKALGLIRCGKTTPNKKLKLL